MTFSISWREIKYLCPSSKVALKRTHTFRKYFGFYSIHRLPEEGISLSVIEFAQGFVPAQCFPHSREPKKQDGQQDAFWVLLIHKHAFYVGATTYFPCNSYGVSFNSTHSTSHRTLVPAQVTHTPSLNKVAATLKEKKIFINCRGWDFIFDPLYVNFFFHGTVPLLFNPRIFRNKRKKAFKGNDSYKVICCNWLSFFAASNHHSAKSLFHIIQPISQG